MTELEAAHQQIADQQKRIAQLEEELAAMARQLAALTRYVFGKRSEQTPPPSSAGQLDLALETQRESPPSTPPAKPGRPKGGSRKGRQSRAELLPGHLPVEETILVDPRVAADPGGWREISRVSTDRLERVPGKLIILRVTRPVYVMRDQPFAAPVTASAPAQLVPGGFLGPRLMADLVLGKYLYHQPLYRQAKALEWEGGITLSAATLCQTIGRVAEAVEPVVRAMTEELWRAPCVQFDLTPVRCLSREHSGGSFMGQMWVCAVPGGDVLYRIETDARTKGLNAEERALMRQRRARRVIRGLRRRIDRTIRDERPKAPSAKPAPMPSGSGRPCLSILITVLSKSTTTVWRTPSAPVPSERKTGCSLETWEPVSAPPRFTVCWAAACAAASIRAPTSIGSLSICPPPPTGRSTP
ncbi:MAG: hypothetical protein EOP86_21150 [Verrucomicrobiaceae bacterium]|nr:MAG: hypothetical protein EOP86_21150 [Verrucomicrobiaceae bacterium]